MAILSADKKYVTVEKGDTLSEIAQKYLGSGSKTTYMKLATINDIDNPDVIFVGQKIYLTEADTVPKVTADDRGVKIKQFGFTSEETNELAVTWSWQKPKSTDHYEIEWQQQKRILGIGTPFWTTFSSTTSKPYDRYSICSVPDDAVKVRVRIKPIAENWTAGKNKDKPKFSADWVTSTTKNIVTVPDAPPAPTVTLDGLKLTATLNNISIDASIIVFEVIKDNNANPVKTGKVGIETGSASYSCTITAGGTYKVRCHGRKDGIDGEWSPYSEPQEAVPAVVQNVKCTPKSESSIYVEWSSTNGAKSYEYQWTTDQDNFGSTNVAPESGTTETNNVTVTGLESGNTYYFRVRAKNIDGKESEWSEIQSAIIGTGPVEPTTWSSTTTAIVGEDESVTLYWVHNSEDGSSQSYAEVELTFEEFDGVNAVVNDVSVEIGKITQHIVNTNEEGKPTITYTVENSTNDKEKDKTHSLTIYTYKYAEGAKIEWRVRTAGITNIQGDWSIERHIDIYGKPTTNIQVSDLNGEIPNQGIVHSFPININASADVPNIDVQRPIGYHVAISANESYTTEDNIGNPKMVNVGELVYSKYFDKHYDPESSSAEPLSITLTPADLSLENGMSYTLNITVSMSSGITIDSSVEFTVSWTDVNYNPNAEISIDTSNYTAAIRPYCTHTEEIYYKVTYATGLYTRTETVLDSLCGEPVTNALTTTGEEVFYGVTAAGEALYFCSVEVTHVITGATLSVYRRNYDGSFTEIMTGLNPADNVVITDPHPALDYARYRIVATDDATGAVSYYDPPNQPVGGKAIIIQWDEEWSAFQGLDEEEIASPIWSGSFVKLPYNIDVSDKHSSDVSLVSYIGRQRPVSYYGTQLGETSTWNVEIARDDEETLYTLRRLATWMGDVYVREPSGSGYWASISLSFSQKHCELTIPVTIDITRVEGGI